MDFGSNPTVSFSTAPDLAFFPYPLLVFLLSDSLPGSIHDYESETLVQAQEKVHQNRRHDLYMFSPVAPEIRGSGESCYQSILPLLSGNG